MNNSIPFKIQVGYACGMLGWSILSNIIMVMLIYFYVPPNNSGLNTLVPQITIFGIFTVLSIIAASGRLLDAITDPFIAYWSDQSKHPKGRRIPFMAASLFPAIILCTLMFIPCQYQESKQNIWWLAFVQAGFYLFITIYIIPYNALLPELATTNEKRIKLATWISFAFVLGVIISSQTPGLADLFQTQFNIKERHKAIQWAIGSLSALGGLFMLLPILVIDEKKHCNSQPTTLGIQTALGQILRNRNFLIFILADFAYFVSLTIISSSLLYILRVLLELEEYIGGQVMGVLVLVSILFYPFVGQLVKRVGKKKLIFLSLAFQGILLFAIYFMGKIPFISPKVQIFSFAVLCAIPAAFLGIIPFALIAEIAHKDTTKTGQQKEAMYFAIRNFSTKLGQTIGIMVFAILTLWGKDPGNDLGIRLAAVFGSILCLVAAVLFLRFREDY